jgi:hypothetical protein
MMILQPTLYTGPAMTDIERDCSGSGPDNPFGMFHREFEGRFYEAFVNLEKPFQFVEAQGSLDSGAGAVARYVDKAHYNDRGAEQLASFVVAKIKPLLRDITAARHQQDSEDNGSRKSYMQGKIVRDEDQLARRSHGTDQPENP